MATFRLNYRPRPYFLALHNRARIQRNAFVLAHRRAGKSYALAAEMIVRALNTKKTNAQFYYIAPTIDQAKRIIWKAFKTILGSFLSQCKINESELTIKFPNTAEIKLLGLVNYDNIRGTYIDGVILDESQDIDRNAIDEVIVPATADREGWIIFAGTPKGMNNSFYDTYKKAKTAIENNDPRWLLLELPASKTKILPEEELARLREELSEEAYAQELELSFTANNRGAILADYVDRAESDDRIVDFPINTLIPVQLSFDLGRDTTAVWFYQIVAGRVDVIDYWQSVGSNLKDDLDNIKHFANERGYTLSTCWLPHDAYDRNYINDRTMQQVFWTANFITDKTPDVSIRSGIDSARALLKTCRIHKTNCAIGIDALKAYSYSFSDKHKCYSSTPIHNWASHASDSFRYLSLSISEYKVAKTMIMDKTDQGQQSGIPTSAASAKKNGYSDEELFFLGIGKYGNKYQSWF